MADNSESEKQDWVDEVLGFGAGFDWITPVMSFFRTSTTDHKHYNVGASWMYEFRYAAERLGIRLHNEMLYGDTYGFGCTEEEYEAMNRYMGGY